MNKVLKIVEMDENRNHIVKDGNDGYVYASILVVVLIVRSFLINHGLDYVNEGVTATYASLYTSLYKRLMHLIESSKGIIGAGRIINFFTTDSTFSAEMLNIVNNIWLAPVHLIVCIYFMYEEVEWCAFLCIGMILIMFILQGLIMNALVRNRFANQRATDKRTKLLQEFLEGIRIIKYYAWERFAYSRVEVVRNEEIKEMSIALRLRTLYEFVAMVLPVATMLVVFSIYSSSVGELTTPKVFTVISYFRILRNPLWMFAAAAIQFVQARASLMRISHFYKLTDNAQNQVSYEDQTYPLGKMSVANGTFAWETPEIKKACEHFSVMLDSKFGKGKKGEAKEKEGNKGKYEAVPVDKPKENIEGKENYIILRDIDITVEPGEIVGVVGLVGCGKSSLVNAMIGEMIKINGDIKYNGRLAYIAQNPWIMNGTLRENIIMNIPYDEKKYDRTIHLCQLTEDLLSFPKA